MVQHIEPQGAHKTLWRKSEKRQHSWKNRATQASKLTRRTWANVQALFLPHLGSLCKAEPV